MSFVFKQDPSFIFNCSVAEVDIHKARDEHEHDEESPNQHMDLVFFLKQEARHSDSNVVAAWSVRVTVFLEILEGYLISENLRR